MKIVASLIALFAIVASGALLATAGAQDVPSFNMTRNCAGSSDSDAAVKSCLKDEQEAHDQLARQWTQFPAPDRANCLQETSSDGTPSYVELLTCLQMARDVRKLPKKDIDFAPYPSISR